MRWYELIPRVASNAKDALTLLTRADLNDHDTYYTSAPSIEDGNYGATTPRKPYPVKLEFFKDRDCIYAPYYSSISEMLDDDPNATAIVRPADLFRTLEEAQLHFRVLLVHHITGVLGDVTELLKLLA